MCHYRHLNRFNPFKVTTIADISTETRSSNALQTQEIDQLTPSDGCHHNQEGCDEDTISISTSLELRRHSSQGDRPCEIFQRQISEHLRRNSPPSTLAAYFMPPEKIGYPNRLINRSALNWLKNVNLLRVNVAIPGEKLPFMQQLYRCSSENILLLSPDHRSYDLSGTPALRKSFSSGILF